MSVDGGATRGRETAGRERAGRGEPEPDPEPDGGSPLGHVLCTSYALTNLERHIVSADRSRGLLLLLLRRLLLRSFVPRRLRAAPLPLKACRGVEGLGLLVLHGQRGDATDGQHAPNGEHVELCVVEVRVLLCRKLD